MRLYPLVTSNTENIWVLTSRFGLLRGPDTVLSDLPSRVFDTLLTCRSDRAD